MSPLVLLYLIIAGILAGSCLVLEKGKRRGAVILTSLWLGMPVITALFFFIFKSPIQRGEILPGAGPLLLLLAPPDDLWVPLDSSVLRAGQRNYSLTYNHLYVGNHVLDMSFGKLPSMEVPEHDLALHFEVRGKGTVLFSKSAERAGAYWGRNKSGLTFIRYKVPGELPLNTVLEATVTVKGDIASFLDTYGETRISIRKGSDL